MLNHLQIKHQYVLKVNENQKVSYTIFHFKRFPRHYYFLFSQYNEEVSQDLPESFIVPDNQSFCLAENVHFTKFVASLNSKFKLPSRTTFRNHIIKHFQIQRDSKLLQNQAHRSYFDDHRSMDV